MTCLVLHLLSFLQQIFQDFSIASSLCQLKLFLSADSASRFLSSEDLLFVSRFNSKIFVVSRFAFCRQMSLQTSWKLCSCRHIQFRASLHLVGKVFAFDRRALSLLWRFHSFCRTFQECRTGICDATVSWYTWSWLPRKHCSSVSLYVGQ